MPDLGKSGMVRMAFSISAAVGGEWIMLRFGSFAIYGSKTDMLYGWFPRKSSIANRRIVMRGQAVQHRARGENWAAQSWSSALRRKRGLATRGYQDLPAPTRTDRTEQKSQIPKSKSQTNS